MIKENAILNANHTSKYFLCVSSRNLEVKAGKKEKEMHTSPVVSFISRGTCSSSINAICFHVSSETNKTGLNILQNLLRFSVKYATTI